MTAASRNSVCYQDFLALVEKANPRGKIVIITDNLSSHNSVSTRDWLAGHRRIDHAFIPVGACWLNLQEAWWRIFRRHALAGVSFATADDIAYVTSNATTQLNQKARPWIWGRPPPPRDACAADSSTPFKERSTSHTLPRRPASAQVVRKC